MFLKPFKLKSNAPLKGSDCKKLKIKPTTLIRVNAPCPFRQRIQTEFPHTNPDLLVPNKSNVSILKLITYGELQISVFCVDKLPMFFENEENKLVPTLYSLWQVPDLLPYFTTHPAVLPKLNNGADLMLPGVVVQGVGMNMYGHYKKGQLVAVNLSSNKSAVGIGYLPRSSDDLYMSGGHGVAVKILHVFGDKLWAIEPQIAQQVPQFKITSLTDDDFPELGSVKHTGKQNKASPNLDEQNEEILTEGIQNFNLDADIAISSQINFKTESKGNIVVANDINMEICNSERSNETTPELMLRNAFLSALKNRGHSLQLPLLTSTFFRSYILPECGQSLDLKKTKYKKLSNFLNEMIDDGFIVVREETKGVDKIISIDFEHPDLVNFVTDYKQPINNMEESNENSLFHSELTELYIVTDAVAALFTKLNYKRGEGIAAQQVKKVIREYINKVNLSLSKKPEDEAKSYILDECLQSICKTNVATLSKIVATVTLQMDHSYQMCTAKDVSGNKPMIQMSLATRSGNKKVTLVSNIECHGIILSEFIKLCKQGAAASTTIVSLPNQKKEMLQIQGNQVRFIYTLLTETYKISPKYILGLELAKDGKKHKRK
ncbi:eukaryotic translation initiation factor 2D isoform X1 [Haematobia irritans]|uniref:eukaryotic translation initiation factor 2D isoform X1 n=1 Tax=Haematobia irritans TaxID=7368 RepID=UPI003F5085D3